jgi:hypothetical protein
MEDTMVAPESLLARIRGEYREMPGLRLTPAQARRLWQLDPPICDAILNALLAEGFLSQTRDGSFIVSSAAAPTVGMRVG